MSYSFWSEGPPPLHPAPPPHSLLLPSVEALPRGQPSPSQQGVPAFVMPADERPSTAPQSARPPQRRPPPRRRPAPPLDEHLETQPLPTSPDPAPTRTSGYLVGSTPHPPYPTDDLPVPDILPDSARNLGYQFNTGTDSDRLPLGINEALDRLPLNMLDLQPRQSHSRQPSDDLDRLSLHPQHTFGGRLLPRVSRTSTLPAFAPALPRRALLSLLPRHVPHLAPPVPLLIPPVPLLIPPIPELRLPTPGAGLHSGVVHRVQSSVMLPQGLPRLGHAPDLPPKPAPPPLVSGPAVSRLPGSNGPSRSGSSNLPSRSGSSNHPSRTGSHNTQPLRSGSSNNPSRNNSNGGVAPARVPLAARLGTGALVPTINSVGTEALYGHLVVLQQATSMGVGSAGPVPDSRTNQDSIRRHVELHPGEGEQLQYVTMLRALLYSASVSVNESLRFVLPVGIRPHPRGRAPRARLAAMGGQRGGQKGVGLKHGHLKARLLSQEVGDADVDDDIVLALQVKDEDGTDMELTHEQLSVDRERARDAAESARDEAVDASAASMRTGAPELQLVVSRRLQRTTRSDRLHGSGLLFRPRVRTDMDSVTSRLDTATIGGFDDSDDESVVDRPLGLANPD